MTRREGVQQEIASLKSCASGAVYTRTQTVVSATFLFRIARSFTRGRYGNVETDLANDNGSQGG